MELKAFPAGLTLSKDAVLPNTATSSLSLIGRVTRRPLLESSRGSPRTTCTLLSGKMKVCFASCHDASGILFMQSISVQSALHAYPMTLRSLQLMRLASSVMKIRPPPRSLARAVSVELLEISDFRELEGTR